MSESKTPSSISSFSTPNRSSTTTPAIQIPALMTPSGSAPPPVQPRQTPLPQETPAFDAKEMLKTFWIRAREKIDHMDSSDLRDPHRMQDVPLARVKKIMKLDDDVKQQMISAEAPVLFSKAAELFIEELTLRAWVNTEINKRKTLQKNDLSMAIQKCDQFDFLIDIVPREEIKNVPPPPTRNTTDLGQASNMQYLVTLPSGEMASVAGTSLQQGISLVNPSSAPNNLQFSNGQFVQATAIGQPIQLSGASNGLQLIPVNGTAGQQIQYQLVQQQDNTETGAHDMDEESN